MKIKSLIFAAAVMLFASAVSCTKETVKETLTVEPSAALSFEVSDNPDVTLTIKTNAQKWEYSVPEWVVATREGETLKVNVAENTAAKARVGRIVITAGSAEPVRINVHQAGVVESDEDPTSGVTVTLNNESETDNFSVSAGSVTALVSVSVEEAATEDIVVEITLDPEYASEYSFILGTSFAEVPAQAVEFSSTELTIPQGQTKSENVELTIDASAFGYGEGTLIPVLAKVKAGEAKFEMDTKRVNYVVMRSNPRTTKQVVYLEVNETNPLNILEYNLEDGTPFFDAVILFAANINYDSVNDVVYIHNNPNVQALLDESEVYLQPLRKKGIKVYLGLLGNHDAAGLAQLSNWGAQQFAKEVAEACRVYKLDGVNLDDEYSKSPDLNNKWFTSPSAAAGARLCYELKLAMKEACYWPTDVSYFQWGSLYTLPTVTDDKGVVHNQSEFIDWSCSDYYGYTTPFGDLTKANCCAASIQLNYRHSVYGLDRAKDGYGWMMWFAFHPSDKGNISNNRVHSMEQFEEVATELYGQSMAQPKNQYNKDGEGKYDPNPHAIN